MKRNQKTIAAWVALSTTLMGAGLPAQNASTNIPSSRPGGAVLISTNQIPRGTNQILRLTNETPEWSDQPYLTNQASRLTNQVLLLQTNQTVRTNLTPIPPGGSREPDPNRRLNPNDRPNPNQPIIPAPSNEKGFPPPPPPNIPLSPPKPASPPAAPPASN